MISKRESSVKIQFKNLGIHPSEDLEIKIFAAPKKRIEEIKKIREDQIVSRIDPNSAFGFKFYPKIENYYYLLLKYKDTFNQKEYYDEFWLCIGSELTSMNYITVEEKKKLEKYVNKIFPERIKKINKEG